MKPNKTGYILALDQGTTSSRAIIFDQNMDVVAIAQKPTDLKTPKAGYVEQDAEQIWQTQINTAQEVINQAGLLATDISAIGITNQRETTIIWDKQTGRPVAPAIVWQDRRTQAWCDNLAKQGQTQRIQAITGLRLDPYFSASKIAWILDNSKSPTATLRANSHDNLRERAEAGELAFGTVDSWLLFNLTKGQHAMDISNASRTLLMDITTGQWSDELLDLFNIPKAILPTILPSNAEFGTTKAGLFAKKIPIFAIMGDQQSALYGQGCVQAGMAKCTYGTGCFLLMNTGDTPHISGQQLLSTVAWQQSSNSPIQTLLKPWRQVTGQTQKNHANVQTSYALEGSVFMAGAIVQWLRDNLGVISDSDDVQTLASQVADSGGVVLIPAFTGLGAPYWQTDVTARLVGMTRGTHKAHIARASLDAIALQVYDILTAMQQDSPVPLTELRVDGGASKNDILMQFQADILGVPVLRPTLTEVTAKGVALMAGQAIGLYDDTTAETSWQLDKRFEPSMDASQRQQILQRWHFYIQQALEKVPN